MTQRQPPSTDEVSDGDLVARVLAGDQAAFSVLFRRHVMSVTAVCRSRVTGHDVDDVVQDTFIKAIERLSQLDDPKAFGGWVRAIAVRACVDLHRRAGRTVALDIFEDHLEVQESNDEVLLRRELATEVHANLSSLPERDREALFLRDGHATPIHELAQRFQLSEGSTRVMLSRARTRLRTAYAAAVAWVVGLRGARTIANRAPQMIAAGALAVAVPLLLIAPAIRPTTVTEDLPDSAVDASLATPAAPQDQPSRAAANGAAPAASPIVPSSPSAMPTGATAAQDLGGDHPSASLGPVRVGTKTPDDPDAEFDLSR